MLGNGSAIIARIGLDLATKKPSLWYLTTTQGLINLAVIS
jgi:hypothetical protein